MEERFAAERDAYSALKEAIESLVARWRYSKQRLWTYDPNLLDILTTEEVEDPEQAEYAYGYDAEGRVVCIREFTTESAWRVVSGRPECVYTKRVCTEQFIRHQPGSMEISKYLTLRDKEVRSICEVRSEGDRIVEKMELSETRASGGRYWQGSSHDQYFWEGQRLKMERSFGAEGNVEFETEWEPDGTHKIYRVLKNGSRYWMDEPPPKGMNVKSLTQFVRKRLVEVIPKAVQAAGLKEPAYCLALAYDGEAEEILGPILGIGLESARQKWLQERGEQAWLSIWNPAEFANYAGSPIQPNDDELDRASGWLNRLLAKREVTAPAIKLLVEVAAELEKLDWSPILPTTPDFVVYAVDFELRDLHKNLRKIVAPRKLAALQAAKLI